jgi:hypothetical protein
VVESNGLEHRHTARYRGFESHPLRQIEAWSFLENFNVVRRIKIQKRPHWGLFCCLGGLNYILPRARRRIKFRAKELNFMELYVLKKGPSRERNLSNSPSLRGGSPCNNRPSRDASLVQGLASCDHSLHRRFHGNGMGYCRSSSRQSTSRRSDEAAPSPGKASGPRHSNRWSRPCPTCRTGSPHQCGDHLESDVPHLLRSCPKGTAAALCG